MLLPVMLTRDGSNPGRCNETHLQTRNTTMENTITLFFYGQQRQISLGERVTVRCHEYGKAVGERATFAKLAPRYAEFVTETGSSIKVYGMKTYKAGAYDMFDGHHVGTGWKKNGWAVDPDENAELDTVRHAEYTRYNPKTFNYEQHDR